MRATGRHTADAMCAITIKRRWFGPSDRSSRRGCASPYR